MFILDDRLHDIEVVGFGCVVNRSRHSEQQERQHQYEGILGSQNVVHPRGIPAASLRGANCTRNCEILSAFRSALATDYREAQSSAEGFYPQVYADKHGFK